MAGQVMEAPMQQQVSTLLGQPQVNCKNDHLAVVTATATAAEMAYLQQLQTAATEANNSNNDGNGAARGEQCPRCASHDTKFCYYNNYNTSQRRHFCRACRRYWTLGGSLRNVPIGGSTRKRPRLAPPPHVVFGGGSVHAGPVPSQGLLGSLFALGAPPLLEGHGGGAGFDLGLGLHMPGDAAGVGDGAQIQGPGPRGGLGGTSSLLWPAGLLDNDNVNAWKMPGGAAAAGAAMWSEFSAVGPLQASGLLHGGAQLM